MSFAHDRNSFCARRCDFLSRASGQIAIAIENALAYHEISELKDKLAQEKLTWKRKFAATVASSGSLGKALH